MYSIRPAKKGNKYLIVLDFCHLIFGFVSNFDIRISNFGLVKKIVSVISNCMYQYNPN